MSWDVSEMKCRNCGKAFGERFGDTTFCSGCFGRLSPEEARTLYASRNFLLAQSAGNWAFAKHELEMVIEDLTYKIRPRLNS